MERSIQAVDVHPEDRDLVSQLAAVQEMHEQVLGLRTLLPQRLWNPILAAIKIPAGSQPTRSPSALFTQLKKTADDGFQEIATFKAAWHSSETQELWTKTKTENFPQGTDTWRVNYRSAINELNKNEKGLVSAAEESARIEEDPKEVIDKFKTKNSVLKLQISEELTIWPLTLTVAGMTFEIDKQVADDERIYQIGTKAGKRTSNVQQEIVRVVQQRKQRDSLAYLLDMLASYDGMRTRACDRCLKIIDDDLQFALLRESKKDLDSTNEAETQWLAYHQKCACPS